MAEKYNFWFLEVHCENKIKIVVLHDHIKITALLTRLDMRTLENYIKVQK